MGKNQVIDTLMNRKSVRKYKDKKVDRETIEVIVQAGQQAPFASQLYSVIFSTKGNLPFKAPIWFVICVDAHKLELFMKRRGWEVVTNDLTLFLFGMQDAAYMAENMVIAAESLGLGSCFLGEGGINAGRIKHLAEKLNLPQRVFPMVELVMGYPDENFPTRPRYPLNFTLFENHYPDLNDDVVIEAMAAMDEGFLKQEYYKQHKAKIKLEDGSADTFTFDNYSWTEHISRKWGQWVKSPDGLLNALKERGFSITKTSEDSIRS